MPLLLFLGTLLTSLFTSVFTFFMQYMTKRFALLLAVVASIGSLTITFFIAFSSLVQALAYSAPSPIVQAFGLAVPDNAVLCLSTVFTAHVMRWVYEWNVKVIQMRLS